MKRTLLRWESWQGLSFGHISILMLTMTYLLSTTFAQEALYAGEEVSCQTSLKVSRLLGFQAYAQGIASVHSGMSNLVYYTVKILLGRGRPAHHYDRLPIPGTDIRKTSVQLSTAKIPICLAHDIHIGTNGLQLAKNDICILQGRVYVRLDYPVVLTDMENTSNHRNISQSIGM